MKLLIFGFGYTASKLERALHPFRPGSVRVTTRSPAKAEILGKTSVYPRIFPGTDVAEDVGWASHILISAGPEDGRDPVLAHAREAFADAKPDWVGYLSTTGVYGDHQGGWVDETAPLTPATDRGRARVAAEAEWQALDLPLHIFRLAGIYGPGRGPFAKVRAGTARRIIKPGQIFSRIHVDDIVQALRASMKQPDPGAIYNICDDDPAPPQEVIAHAAALLGIEPPPEVPIEEAEMTPMATSFYAESKRVDNSRMKRELGVRLKYPTYREGLAALLEAGE